ncbi:MAG: hypothetical protein Q8M09_18295 [Pseudomonadota bacterium]|nr:hypothetical protein [Pseudomonadota bacterium]MDP1572930.1 hypothetical protein [Pseudomonadota bacterium]MDP1906166.1 hypothetical protein [Pseudomonadota bacterium]
MKIALIGLMMLLTVGMARAETSRPSQTGAAQAGATAPAPSVQSKTSSARKAEATRRMFWLALSLRSSG